MSSTNSVCGELHKLFGKTAFFQKQNFAVCQMLLYTKTLPFFGFGYRCTAELCYCTERRYC